MGSTYKPPQAFLKESGKVKYISFSTDFLSSGGAGWRPSDLSHGGGRLEVGGTGPAG